MAWIVVASLEALRAEFNRVFPNRDKTSDGGIGDQAHATGASGHNPDETGHPEDYDADNIDEVRARDFDSDLRHPTVDMEQVTQHLVGECRAGRITWIKYLIYNRRIWRASNGWKQEAYTGSSPHTEHLHVSCKPDTASENNTRPVGLASLVEADVNLDDKIGDPANPDRTVRDVLKDVAHLRGFLVGDPKDSAVTPPTGTSPVASLMKMAQAFPALAASVQALAGKDFTDEAAIVAGLLAGMDYRKFADAVVEKLPDRDAKQLLDALAARLAA